MNNEILYAVDNFGRTYYLGKRNDTDTLTLRTMLTDAGKDKLHRLTNGATERYFDAERGEFHLDNGWTVRITQLNSGLAETFGEVIYRFTREDAINDGVLHDVTHLAYVQGFRHPVAMTDAIHRDIVNIPDEYYNQTPQMRLECVLYKACQAVRKKATRSRELRFTMILPTVSRDTERYQIKMVVGPGDFAEPVLTMMLPDED